MILKRPNDELKANRPTLKEIKNLPKLPIYILLENIRSVHNVGSVFRTADGIGAMHLYLTGYTAHPPRNDLGKVSLGAEKSVSWSHNNNSLDAVGKIKNMNIQLVALEQTHNSISLFEYDWIYPVCFILGNEVKGISEDLLTASDAHVEIPMHGVKQSLNVSVACGVAGYEIARAYSRKRMINTNRMQV